MYLYLGLLYLNLALMYLNFGLTYLSFSLMYLNLSCGQSLCEHTARSALHVLVLTSTWWI